MNDKEYKHFLDRKRIVLQESGITVPHEQLNPNLFEFQRDIVAWALRKGRAAIFCDCGMGKTIMQLDWAHHVPGDVLILAPLAVAQQTVREAKKFGMGGEYSRKGKIGKVTVANYEMLEHFNPSEYAGIVLDESSILKSFDGVFRNQIIESFDKTPFRLACTATPAPNDYMELGNHSEFLGALSRTEMLSTFFVHDGGETSKWRLKRHAQNDFWEWVCSWAVMMRKPSDLGYSDDGFILPEMEVHDITIEQVKPTAGMLFAMPAATLQERRQARSGSIEERAAEVARIIAQKPNEPWLVWCNLNVESLEAHKRIACSVDVSGSDSRELKEEMVEWFTGGKCICGLAKKENTSKHTGNGLLSGEMNADGNFTPKIQSEENITLQNPSDGEKKTRKRSLRTGLDDSLSPQMNIGKSSENKAEDALFAGQENLRTFGIKDSTLTTVTTRDWSGVYSALPAISGLDNSKIVTNSSEKRQCTCGHLSGKRILITKPSIFGFGLNFQHCPNVVFLGLSDSYEQFYQAVRRCWRFGQKNKVHCYIVTSSNEGAVTENIKRKERDAANMAEEMVNNMHELNQKEIHGGPNRGNVPYAKRTEKGKGWEMQLGDCVELVRDIPTESIHYSIFSPPFASLYTYSASERDMGNCRTHSEFYMHFNFFIQELYRVMMNGRLVSFHCMNLPKSKERDGVIGITDFRGELIRMFEHVGFIYHSEVVIWKDPVTAMQRTKAIGLLHKQIKKDSTISRQGIPDYLVTMRKPGENKERVTHTNESFPVSLWQKYASPVWMDINPSNTLQRKSAREHEDERHICPLQLQVIERAMELWTNPKDLVLSPFAGIGSEGYVATAMGRRFLGFELKESYFKQAVLNLKSARTHPSNIFEAQEGEYENHEAMGH